VKRESVLRVAYCVLDQEGKAAGRESKGEWRVSCPAALPLRRVLLSVKEA
jgi:hypothetical protein